jgi:hypothetical protein
VKAGESEMQALLPTVGRTGSTPIVPGRDTVLRRRIIHLLTVALVALAGLMPAATAAQAAVEYDILSVRAPGVGTCGVKINTSNSTINQPGLKHFALGTTAPAGCTLEVYLHSNSNAYSAYVVQANSQRGFDLSSLIHRVRICQSGTQNYVGKCSPTMWWNGDLH